MILELVPREPSISINTDGEYHYPAVVVVVVAHFEYERSRDIMLIERTILQYSNARMVPGAVPGRDFSPTSRFAATVCIYVCRARSSRRISWPKTINKRKGLRRRDGAGG